VLVNVVRRRRSSTAQQTSAIGDEEKIIARNRAVFTKVGLFTPSPSATLVTFRSTVVFLSGLYSV
jgi:hypothetical protein